MSNPLTEEQGALSNLPDEDMDLPYNLAEAPGSHLKAIEQEEHDIASGQLNGVMESIAYEPHPNDIDLKRLKGREFKPAEYVVEPLLPKRNPTLMSGNGDSWKSITSLQIGICVATGEPFAGLPVTQGRVLYYSLEDDEEMVGSRLTNMCEKLDVNPDDLDGMFVARDMCMLDIPYLAEEGGRNKITFTKSGQALLDEIAARHFDLIIIDNASEAYAADEMSRPMVRQFMGKLAVAAKAGDCAVALISHVNKESAKGNSSGGQNYSGSTQWHNSARSRLYFERDKNHLTITQEKLNVGMRMQEPLIAEFKDGALYFDEKAIEKRDQTAEDKARRAMFPDLLRTLFWAEENSKEIRTGISGPGNVNKCLGNIPCYPRRLKQAPAKKDVPSALNLMESEKLVKEVTRKNDQRKDVKFWELTDAGRAAALRVIEGGDMLIAEDEETGPSPTF